MTAPKRPLLPKDERARLGRLADNAARHREERGGNSAYARGVEDVLRWLNGDTMTALLQEVTQ